ncbi:MAG: T9SS type A sorting domain-containing protein [Bacteroidota bacterium]
MKQLLLLATFMILCITTTMAQQSPKNSFETPYLLTEKDIVPRGLLSHQNQSSKTDLSKSFTDDILVTNPLTAPFSFNVFVEVETVDGLTLECSGALIDTKWVLLAGNCISSKDFAGFKGLVKKVRVYPAYDTDNNIPFGFAESADIIVQDEWAFDRDMNYNIGYIPLDRPIGASVQYWTGDPNSDPAQFIDVVVDTDDTYDSEIFTSQSYPLSSGFEAGKMYTRTGTFEAEDVQENVVYANPNSAIGQSGAVLYRFDGGIPKTSAVLSHNRNGRSGYVRLNEDVASTINRLIVDGYNIVGPDGDSGNFIESRPFSPDLIPLPAPNLPQTTNTQQTPGEQLDTLYAGVTNYSKNDYNGNFELEIFISKDDQFDLDDLSLRAFRYTGRVNPDESFFFDLSNLVTIPANLPSGQYYIGVKLNAFESNRRNEPNNIPLQGDLRPITIGTGIEPANPCEQATKLDCGVTYSFNTTNETNDYDNINELYEGCIDESMDLFWDYEARDILLSFDVLEQGDVTIEMTNLRTFFDFFVFRTCAPGVLENAIISDCIGISYRGGLADETLLLPDLAAGTYYIIVDGSRSSNRGTFDIRVDCPIVEPDPCTLVDEVLACGNTYNGDTNNGTSRFELLDYQGDCSEGLPPAATFEAPDQLFAFSVPEAQTWDIQMASTTADVDLEMFLFEGSACEEGVFDPCFDRAGQLMVDSITTTTTTTMVMDTIVTTTFDTTTTIILDTMITTVMDTITTTTLDTITTTTMDTTITVVDGVTVMIINVVTNTTVNVLTNNVIQPVTTTVVDTTTIISIDTIITTTIDTMITETTVMDTINYTVDSIKVINAIPPGQYYLVVDGASSNSVGAFTIDISCDANDEGGGGSGIQAEIPSICDLGGEFVSGDRINVQDLSLNPAEDVTFADVLVPDCVLARYGSNALSSTYFDTYILFLTPTEAAQGVQLDFTNQLDAFVFDCSVGTAGEEAANCLVSSSTGSGTLNFRPNTTDADGTFYYIVLAGEATANYDLRVQIGQQVSPCQQVSQIIESVGIVEIGSLLGQTNKFDIAGDTEASNIYSCYVGRNTFEGPDVVYQLEVKETTTLDIILDANDTSLPFLEGTEFGIFLYDYKCGAETAGCIRYDETSGDDNILEINIELIPGFYYLVLDSDIRNATTATNEEEQTTDYNLIKNSDTDGYQLDIAETIRLRNYNYSAPLCVDSLDLSTLSDEELDAVTYQVNTARTFNNIRIGRHRLSSEDIIAYYYLNGERPKLAAANSYDEEGFAIRVRGLEEADPFQEKCAFANGDAVVLKIDDGHSAVYDVAAILGTKLDGSNSDAAFMLGGQMVLDSLRELKTKRFKVVPNVVNLNNLNRSRCNCTYINILADSEDNWELEGPEGVVFTPSAGSGNKRVKIEIEDTRGLDDNTVDKVIKITRRTAEEIEPDVLNSRKVQIIYRRAAEFISTPETEERSETVTKQQVQIVPNPASDHFMILANGEQQLQGFQIFDGFGQLVHEQTNVNKEQLLNVNTEAFAAGVYFLRIAMEKQILTKRVVVQH